VGHMENREETAALVGACVLLIGDEILSGRTRDANLSYIAKHLNDMGIQVREARIVPDVEAVIVDAINDARARFDYVFTTGGIGPTHDDITADAVAKAFGVSIDYHPEAMAILERHYKETGNEFTSARKRMARMPDGALLIDNPVSKAPGFQIENVFVMAGIPIVMQTMLDSLSPRLKGGRTMLSRTLRAHIAEGQIAEPLGAIQAAFPDVSVGSYPFYTDDGYGAAIVMRCVDEARLEAAQARVSDLILSFGLELLPEDTGKAGG